MNDLYTIQGKKLMEEDGLPWDVYPRPQMRRDSFINLNGWWDLAVSEEGQLPGRFTQRIRVPFVPESLLSGIHTPIADGSTLWYRRKIRILPEEGKRVLLHIGAADQKTTLWIGERRVKLTEGYSSGEYTHEGGYEPFTYDITEALKEEETELLLQVHDALAGGKMPYGKQSLQRGGMWYTPCSGIWQTVWLEVVPEVYIRKIHTTTSPVSANQPNGPWKVTFELLMSDDRKIIRDELVEEPRLWSPKDPCLYEREIAEGEDRIRTYFALRALETKTIQGKPRLCLNGKPFFFHGLLDQGYWSDGLFTPADPAMFEEEILKLKAMGFNMLRKHIKVEPELFYYACDKLGMTVFQDMVQNGIYDFKHDTIYPTIGLMRINDQKLHPDPESRENFIEGMLQTVRTLKNHPSIVYWTIFNEGWGQFSGTQVYMQLRKEDDTRWIDTASGWFHPAGLKTDVESRHVYFKRVRPVHSDKPFVLSEFGGYAYMIPEHSFNPDKVYGYRMYKSREALGEAVRKLYRDQVIPLIGKGLCGAIYTQVSDVEDETNGVFTYDRKVQKILPEDLDGIMDEISSLLPKE
ncbi:MAG: glycoside hydrolase family 2 [Firmicutes bacterium]|nr:glycoside hydrolase family 2 [Bacillota bacterium]